MSFSAAAAAAAVRDGDMAAEEMSAVRVEERPGRGRALVTTRDVAAGEVMLTEAPLAAAQFAWNAACGYRACGQCLRSLEPAAEMFRRLAGLDRPPALPHEECCTASRLNVARCQAGCSTEYCSEECRDIAWREHHMHLCPLGEHGATVTALQDAWKEFHSPPETTSAELFCRIVIAAVTSASADNTMDVECDGHPFAGTPFAAFCSETELPGGFTHKTMDPEWAVPAEHIRRLMIGLFDRVFPGSHVAAAALSEPGFRALVAMVGRNGAGIGTSAIAAYDAKVTALEMDDIDRLRLDTLLNGLYEAMDEVSGEFLDCEGSGLYAVQSACNHACEPNAEYSFPQCNALLHLTALEDIAEGEEVLISYLDPCSMRRCRNYRQQELARSYLFECACAKCEAQVDCPDESDEDDEEEEEEDTRCIPIDDGNDNDGNSGPDDADAD